MKKISVLLFVFFILIFLIYPISSTQPAINHNQNYTAVLTYGQTPYQTGFLSKSNVSGWTWWDTNDSTQDRKQRNIIFVNIYNNKTPTPVSGLAPPAWIRTNEDKNGGTFSYKADYDGQGNYDNNMDMWHILDDHSTYDPPWKDFNLLNSSSYDLIFSTNYSMEQDRDFGYVKISTDKGKTWTELAAYTGTSGGWIQETIDISAYTGKEAIIAFNFKSDNKNVGQGWYIDDISISNIGPSSTSLQSQILKFINSLIGTLATEIYSDGAEDPIPVLSAIVEYPTYNHTTETFSIASRVVDLVENYQSQGLYYGFFYFENTSDTYTGEYLIKFNQIMPDTSSISVNSTFNTTLWGCQATGCHDSYNLINDLNTNISNTSIHPNGIVSPGVGGDCQSQCHSPYSSQFLTATPTHLHEIRYGHEGGFIIGESGNITIFNVSSPTTITVTMYSESDIIRPRKQTTFNIDSHSQIVNCQDCHTSFIHKNIGTDEHLIGQSETLVGTNISSSGVHANNVTCEECHGNLSYPVIPIQSSLTGTIGSYNPTFTSYLSNTKTYIIDVQNDIDINVSIDNPTFGVTLTLIGPIDNTSGLQDLNTGDDWEGTYFVPSIAGSITFKTGSQIFYPLGGLKVSGFTDPSSKGTWIARLFSWSPGSTNFTITSNNNNPIVEKPIIHIPWNCSECHNPSGIGNASTNRTIPSWDNNGLSFAHTDFNDDSFSDVPCRSCHNSFHEIAILTCRECHNSAPPGHNNIIVGFNYVNAPYNSCLSCHGDPHNISPGGGANCTECHLEGGAYTNWDGPILNKTGFFNSLHYNITGDFDATNYTNISKVCWGCHVNYTEQQINPMHTRPVSELPVCEDCHFNETPLNGQNLTKIPPIQIPEHQPLGEDIQTNISTGCTLCHNNSLSIPIPTTKVKYAEAKNYVSHYLNNKSLMTPTINTTDCMWCHVDNSNNISWGRPTDPFNSTKLNHTPFNLINSTDCYPCHISNEVKVDGIPQAEFTFHNESMAPGAGKDCVICHDIDGMVSEQFQIDVQAMNRSDAIHYDLNRGAAVTADPNSVRCWACHGDGNGSEAAQPDGHPINYTTPKNCVDQACHNFNQSIFNEPMVYEHIKHVDDIENHVSTTVNCQDCHKNSVMNNLDTHIPNDTSLVSHYGSTYNLVNTSDCIYCHYDEDNAEEWGNAPDPRNHTHYDHVEKTLVTGEPWYLMDNYVIRLIETTEDTAVIHLEKYGARLDREFVSEGEYLEFEISGIETDDTTFVKLMVNNIFSAEGNYAVELSGDVLASRLHKETQNNQCYECHDREYRANLPDGRDYTILDKDDENVTLGLMLVNFKEDDEKSLRMGEYWDLGEGYKLYVTDVNIKGISAAHLKLYRNETLVQDAIINEGSIFTYEDWVLDREIVVFSAKLDLVFVGITTAPPVVIIKDVRLIGSERKILDADLWALQTKTLLGSLPLDSIITVGNEPETFHVYTISPGEYSSDCISCHAGNGVAPIKIDLDTFKMGVHVDLNQNAYYNSFISDEANKACWACHANGSEPIEHPSPYLGKFTPKTCRYCHEHSRFDATQIFTHFQGSEISTSSTCNDCHSNAIPENILTDDQAATSHYSTRDALLNTSHCDYCHNNETNAPIWGNAPQVTKHNANNNCTLCHAGEGITTFHGEGITITRTCEDCHVDKQQAEKYHIDAIITHYPGASEEDANTLKNNEYTCRVCHNSTNNSLHTNLEVREYQNETMGFCFQCHSEDGEFPYKSQSLIGDLRHGSGVKAVSGCDNCHAPEGISRFHTPTLLGKGTFRGAVRHDIDCLDCHPDHEGQEYQPYEGIQCVDCHTEYGSVHYAGAEIQMVNQTNTCALCHNDEADIYHDLTRLVGNVSDEVFESCRVCHKDIDTLKDNIRSASIAGGTMATISHPTSESTITCSSCHNSTGENRFHFDSYPLGTVQNPEWQNWTAGNITGCKDCHTYQGGELPFNATNMRIQGTSPSGTAHGLAPNCTLCHGGNDPISLHYLATSRFIPRLAVTLNPEEVHKGEKSFLQVAVVLPTLTKMTRAEYFIDDFSGEGFGNPLEYIVGGDTDSSVLLGALIDSSDLSIGKHAIFVHVKDSSGKWSNLEINTLNVKNPVGTAIIETMFKDIIPIAIFAIILYFIWKRLR